MPKTVIREFFGKFWDDQRGAVAVLVASGVVVLVGVVGMATDTTRAYLLKARLAQALDASALAGGRNFYHPNRNDDIRMYFSVNLPQGYMGAEVVGDPNNPNPYGPLIVDDLTNGTVTLSASAKIPTTFMKIFGQDYVNITASTEVTRYTRTMDVVIAIDMSGSMNKTVGGSSTSDETQTRIYAAQNAARELVTSLWGSTSTAQPHQLLNVAVVPWNGQVNVAADGSTYDPDPATTSTAPATPNYDHPITGATVTEHYFVSNSPVPMLHLPPGRTTIKTFNLQFDDQSGNKNRINILSSERWDTEGFSVGGTVTFTNAENSGNEGTFTIVEMTSDGKEITVYPATGMVDNNNDTTVESQGEYIWDGCVYARYIPTGAWPSYDAGVTFTNASDAAFANDADTVGYSKSFGSRQWAAWEPITGETYFSTTSSYKCAQSQTFQDCAAICPQQGITPLTNVRSEIDTAIDRLLDSSAGLTPGGSTNIPQGLAWAFRVLTPGVPFNQATPTVSLTTKRTQAIILLTDGENQNYWGNAYKGIWGSSSDVNTDSGRIKMNERLLDLAAEIKGYNAALGNDEDPIEIYSIMFVDPNASGVTNASFTSLETLMKAVATKPTEPYYYNAPSAAQLTSVFKAVASHLSALRISK